MGLDSSTPGGGVDAPDVMMMNGSKPLIILEVLFIAVWENDRGGEFGSSLVSALEFQALAYARRRGHKFALLYVEIGFEQPLAKKFWGNNGFSPVASKSSGCHASEDVFTGRIIELEDYQLGFIDRRCLRFKDTKQYAKVVLVD